jgi:aquaporin Z
MTQKAVVELIGTFFLVLVIGLTAIAPGAGSLAPLAIGLVLMVMVYAGGHVSGAHYNPAVTLAVWMRGKCPAKEVPGYLIGQLGGAALAALFCGWVLRGLPIVPIEINWERALPLELVFTFALAFVVLNVATAKRTAGNSYFGLAIGMTVTASAYAAGGISGGMFNPAVAVGLTVLGLSQSENLWVYIVATLAGGALAALAFKFTNTDRS